MTPQYILKAGLQDYMKAFTASDYTPSSRWDTPENKQREAESLIENLEWASEYAEPGYSQPSKGILFADWNHVSKRTLSLLEQAGYECKWSNEWSTCEDCNKAVRTQADSYGWGPSYVILNDCEIVCTQCLIDGHAVDYLETLLDRPNRALGVKINPAEYGFERLEGEFESGFHPGQTDNPKAITKALRDKGETRPLLFRVDSRSQFDTGFSVWAKLAEVAS